MSHTRDQWIDRAIEILMAEGIAAVSAKTLAASLGSGRSTFYRLFRDRRDLLDAILARWVGEVRGDKRDKLASLLTLPPRERIRQALTEVRTAGPIRFDLAIRAWALFDPVAHKTVCDVEAERFRLYTQTLRELGHKPKQAEIRARAAIGWVLYENTVGNAAGEPVTREWLKWLTTP